MGPSSSEKEAQACLRPFKIGHAMPFVPTRSHGVIHQENHGIFREWRCWRCCESQASFAEGAAGDAVKPYLWGIIGPMPYQLQSHSFASSNDEMTFACCRRRYARCGGRRCRTNMAIFPVTSCSPIHTTIDILVIYAQGVGCCYNIYDGD